MWKEWAFIPTRQWLVSPLRLATVAFLGTSCLPYSDAACRVHIPDNCWWQVSPSGCIAHSAVRVGPHGGSFPVHLDFSVFSNRSLLYLQHSGLTQFWRARSHTGHWWYCLRGLGTSLTKSNFFLAVMSPPFKKWCRPSKNDAIVILV